MRFSFVRRVSVWWRFNRKHFGRNWMQQGSSGDGCCSILTAHSNFFFLFLFFFFFYFILQPGDRESQNIFPLENTYFFLFKNKACAHSTNTSKYLMCSGHCFMQAWEKLSLKGGINTQISERSISDIQMPLIFQKSAYKQELVKD